jgi:ATP-binding cassette subfamily A (ABC1) protein 3
MPSSIINVCETQAGRNIGYCPQFDALIGQMTGMETLCMYARLRGVPERRVNTVANAVVDAVGIKQYANRNVDTYR